MKCLGKNHKGINCNFKPLDNDQYCKLHQSYKKMILLQNEGTKICKNWIRGCWNIIIDSYERCLECRINEREKDKILREKKKINATEYNNNNKDNLMCNVCNKITNTLKNNKCDNCYVASYNTNKNRNPTDKLLTKLYEYKSGAKKRNFNLPDDLCFELFKSKCNYCNEIDDINGIDRIDSNKCYEKLNCVSCCTQCNFMKNNTDQKIFIKLCEHIATYNNIYEGNLHTNILKNTKNGKFTEYKKRATNKNMKFLLSKSDFINIIGKPCDYCGISDETFYKIKGAGGIDRVNSNQGYILENCVPCCGICNKMKLAYSKDEFLNKCLKITLNQLNDVNQFNIEQQIIDGFNKFKKINNKKYKKIFDHSKEYYENRVWHGTLEDLKKIKIKLIIVDNDELNDIWNYYKHTVSSLKLTTNSHLVGKQIYILVADQITQKYLGIISLSSDYLKLEDRDKFIGWTKEDMLEKHMLNYILNISTCVPLQPFGFNFTGGKLLTKLVFSREVQNIFKKKYNHPLLGITTTSLYGKSIQYDRLKEISLIGYTKGNSVYKYTTEFIQLCKKYLHDYHNINNINKKLFIISSTLQKLELPKDEYMMENPKGIYFGFIYPDSKDFLCGKIKKIKDTQLKSCDEIFNEWLNRWAIQRSTHLVKENKFITIIKNTSTERVKKLLNKLKNKNITNVVIKCVKEPYNEPVNEQVNESVNESNNKENKFTEKPDLPSHFSLYKEKES